jgi:hypothetical protein
MNFLCFPFAVSLIQKIFNYPSGVAGGYSLPEFADSRVRYLGLRDLQPLQVSESCQVFEIPGWALLTLDSM